MFHKQRTEIEAVARALHASQLRKHRAKRYIAARVTGLKRNPLTYLLPFTAGMLTGARQLRKAPGLTPSLPVPSLSRLNHLLTFVITTQRLSAMYKQKKKNPTASAVNKSGVSEELVDAHLVLSGIDPLNPTHEPT